MHPHTPGYSPAPAQSPILAEVSPDAKALIFDCDGTLIDTMQLHYDAFHEELAVWGYHLDHAYLETFAGSPTDVILDTLNSRFGWTIDAGKFAVSKEQRFTNLLPRATEIEVVTAVARAYRGQLPMAVVSGGIIEHVEASIQAIVLEVFFGAVITASNGVKAKPHPDMFLLAAERLGVAPQFCQVFEDADAGIAGARAAGMLVTDVRPFTVGIPVISTQSRAVSAA